MKQYQNLSGNSGITHYHIGEDFIELKFERSNLIYVYSDKITGKTHIRKMKSLAEKGMGLSTYIAQNPKVKHHYTIRE
jgi:hypothetical protein